MDTKKPGSPKVEMIKNRYFKKNHGNLCHTGVPYCPLDQSINM